MENLNFAEVKENTLTQLIGKDVDEITIKTLINEIEKNESWEELKEVIADNIYYYSLIDILVPDGYYKTNRCEFTIVNGRLNGEYKEYYPDGQLYAHCTFKNGKVHGEYRSWWLNGKPAEHSYNNNGKLEGEYKEWYKNGKLFQHCFYKNDELDGEFKRYYMNGKLELHRIYKDGEVIECIK
jgi:antitoxin component YwqK of YwqJK toxin-antitoxin module